MSGVGIRVVDPVLRCQPAPPVRAAGERSGKRELGVPPLGRSLLASLAVAFFGPSRFLMPPKMGMPLRRAAAPSRGCTATELPHEGSTHGSANLASRRVGKKSLE